MNKIKVGAKIKVNAENPTTAHTLARYVKRRAELNRV